MRLSVYPVAFGRERFPDRGGTPGPGAGFCPHFGQQSGEGSSSFRLPVPASGQT